MAGEWRTIQLGDFIELKRGYDLPKQARMSGRVPIVTSSGVGGYHHRAMAHAPGVVTGRYGTIGQVFYIKEDFWPLNTTLYVKNFMGADPRFVTYLLQSVDFMSCSDKAAVPGINRNDLHRLTVRVPGEAQQRAIASILGSLDDKIELNHRTSETLEFMAQALFKSWFVDCVSSRNLETVAALVEQGLLQVGDGYRAKNSEMSNEGIPFIRVADVFDGCVRTVGTDLLCSESASALKGKISQPFDVVLTTKGSVGRFAFVSPQTPTFVYSPQLCYWRCPHPDRLSPHYIWHWMRSRWFLDQIDMVKGQTDMAEYVSLGDQRRMRVPVPSTEAQAKLSDSLHPIQFRIWRIQEESSTLTELRDTLLPKLLSGALPIREAERFLP